MECARVLVVEDDPAIRCALEVALKEDGYDVRAEADGCCIDQVAMDFRPDLAILDVRLPNGPDGYEISRKLCGGHGVAVVFLTAADGIDERLAGFDAGGDDYVIKPFSLAEIRARVRALLRRAGKAASGVVKAGDLLLNDGDRSATRSGSAIELTPTEFDLLSVMANKPGQVFSKIQLLNQVWGFDHYDPNLVEVHISSMRQKLETVGPRVVHTVRGSGYVFREVGVSAPTG